MQPLVTELLFRRMPTWDAAALCGELAEPFGQVDVAWDGDVQMIRFHDHPLGVRGRQEPYALLVREEEVERWSEDYREPLSQCWDWAEAEESLQGCGYLLAITDPMGHRLPPHLRLAFLHGVVRSLVVQTEPAVLHWCDAERLVDPEGYLGALQVGDWLKGPLNLRRFQIDDANDGELLDTLGFHALGLPDLEVRAPEGHREALEAVLRDLAQRLLEGEPLPDVLGGWHLNPGSARVAPARRVLRLEAQPE